MKRRFRRSREEELIRCHQAVSRPELSRAMRAVRLLRPPHNQPPSQSHQCSVCLPSSPVIPEIRTLQAFRPQRHTYPPQTPYGTEEIGRTQMSSLMLFTVLTACRQKCTISSSTTISVEECPLRIFARNSAVLFMCSMCNRLCSVKLTFSPKWFRVLCWI